MAPPRDQLCADIWQEQVHAGHMAVLGLLQSGNEKVEAALSHLARAVDRVGQKLRHGGPDTGTGCPCARQPSPCNTGLGIGAVAGLQVHLARFASASEALLLGGKIPGAPPDNAHLAGLVPRRGRRGPPVPLAAQLVSLSLEVEGFVPTPQSASKTPASRPPPSVLLAGGPAKPRPRKRAAGRRLPFPPAPPAALLAALSSAADLLRSARVATIRHLSASRLPSLPPLKLIAAARAGGCPPVAPAPPLPAPPPTSAPTHGALSAPVADSCPPPKPAWVKDPPETVLGLARRIAGAAPVGWSGFIRPVDEVWEISSHFGPRWGRHHNGVDLAAPAGEPVLAADAGTVTFAGWEPSGFGYLVEITHQDGWRTLYGHNSELYAWEGQRVERGDCIASVGETGRATGPHLHWEIRNRLGCPVDPSTYVKL